MTITIGKNHQQAMGALTERKSKLTSIKKIARKTAGLVEEAILQLLASFKKWVHTITVDNGKEFADYANIAKRLGIKFYFADLYSSWQLL